MSIFVTEAFGILPEGLRPRLSFHLEFNYCPKRYLLVVTFSIGHPHDRIVWLSTRKGSIHISEVDENGQNTNYFVKIIAVNADDTLVDGVWFSPDGTEIGTEIWGQFAVIQEVSTPGGLTYKAPNPGLGNLN